LNQTFRFNYGY